MHVALYTLPRIDQIVVNKITMSSSAIGMFVFTLYII